MTDLNPTNHGLPPHRLVDKALAFATVAHGGQKRKYTHAPYIVHPIAVAQMVWATDNCGLHAVCAALLHDTIEDCDVTYDDIANEFGNFIANLVQDLSDQADPAWNRATRKAWEAGRLSTCGRVVQTIKCADLHHNTMDIIPYDSGFAKVYLAEKRVVLTGLVRADTWLLKATWSQLNAAEGLLKAGD
jgi:(p)ppGpp synthase/HD superfamily hydrolase